MSNVPLVNVSNRSSDQQSAAPIGAPLAVVQKYIAGEALTPGLGVKFGGSDNVVVQSDAETDLHIGVYVGDRVAAAGEEVPVVIMGVCTAIAGDTVTRGEKVTAETATARIVTAGEGDNVLGVALASAVDGGKVPVLVVPSVYPAEPS